jgi:GT2 family glycosyltransferase
MRLEQETQTPILSVLTVAYNSDIELNQNVATWFPDTCQPQELELILESNDKKSVATSPELKQVILRLGNFQNSVNPKNIGFAAAVNKAARTASSKWILLVNPDVEFYPDSMTRILEYCETAEALDTQVISISMLTGSGVFNGVCLKPYGILADQVAKNVVENPIGPSGGALIITRGLFLELGGFCEDLFMWAEDAEFALRLQRFGHSTNTLDLRLKHTGGHSLVGFEELNRKAFLLARNRMLALRMHSTPALLVLLTPMHVIACLMRVLSSKIFKNTALSYLKGLGAGLFGPVPSSGLDSPPDRLGVAWWLGTLRNQRRPQSKLTSRR